ncbi:hypothetical protein EV401DRAFT_2081155, partial [Pisolithus croceorrhizus]
MSFGDGHVRPTYQVLPPPRWARPHPKNLHVPSSPALSPRGRSYHPTHTLKIYEYLRHLPCQLRGRSHHPPPTFKNLPGRSHHPPPTLKNLRVPSSPAVSPRGRSHHPPPKFKILPGPTTPHPHLKIYQSPQVPLPARSFNTNLRHLPRRLKLNTNTPSVPSSPACRLKVGSHHLPPKFKNLQVPSSPAVSPR